MASNPTGSDGYIASEVEETSKQVMVGNDGTKFEFNLPTPLPSSSESEEEEENIPPESQKRKHIDAFGPNAGLELRASDRKSAEPDVKKINTETDEAHEERMEIIAAAGRVGLYLKDQQAWNTLFMNTSKYPKDVRIKAQAEFEQLCKEQDAIMANIKEKKELALLNNDSWSPTSKKGKGKITREAHHDPRVHAAAEIEAATKASELSRQAATQAHLQEQDAKKKTVELTDIESGCTSTIEAPTTIAVKIETNRASRRNSGTGRGNERSSSPSRDNGTGRGTGRGNNAGRGAGRMQAHITYLRGQVSNQTNSLEAMASRVNAIEEKLDSVLHILTTKCPHKNPTAAQGDSNGDDVEGNGDTASGGKDADASSSSGAPAAHQGNTGRINVTFPNSTFNILSSNNRGTDTTAVEDGADSGTVSTVEGSRTHCANANGDMVCASCKRGPPINGHFSCVNCKGFVHLHCGNSKSTGPSRMCKSFCDEQLNDKASNDKENAVNNPCVKAHKQCQTSLVDNMRKPPPVPASQLFESDSKRGSGRLRSGESKVMSSPPDPILGSVGGADISGIGGDFNSADKSVLGLKSNGDGVDAANNRVLEDV